MEGVASKVAIMGSGISGAVCASILAKNGISATIFESARGPGGRMSQRREHSEDGRELLFDHGAPYFTVSDTNLEVRRLVDEWEARGFVAEWKERFGSFDCLSKKFSLLSEEERERRYVGVPGMNSICKALCLDPGIKFHPIFSHSAVDDYVVILGVESRFGVGVARIDWLEDEDMWSLNSSVGEDVGRFDGVVASDKNTFLSRFTEVTGKPPPIDMGLQIKEIPVVPCFALMLAFDQPLSKIPWKGLLFKNSKALKWAFCDSSKPGRPKTSERWVLHSTAEHAELIISQTGFQKPSSALLAKVAEDLFREFERTGLCTTKPFFMKAHRWGSAFPAAGIAVEEKCLWFGNKKLAICGDFCVGPKVECAISSGIAAASKFVKM